MTNEFNLSEKEIQDLINHGFATVNGAPLSTLTGEYTRSKREWLNAFERKPKLERDPKGRTCPNCIEDLNESIPLDSNGTCHGCGSNFGKSTVDS